VTASAERTPFEHADPLAVAELWQRFLNTTGRAPYMPPPEAWAFGDSVELADELITLVIDGPKRATAGLLADPYWLDAHTGAFRRACDRLGLDFDPDIITVFERFDVVYLEH